MKREEKREKREERVSKRKGRGKEGEEDLFPFEGHHLQFPWQERKNKKVKRKW